MLDSLASHVFVRGGFSSQLSYNQSFDNKYKCSGSAFYGVLFPEKHITH